MISNINESLLKFVGKSNKQKETKIFYEKQVSHK